MVVDLAAGVEDAGGARQSDDYAQLKAATVAAWTGESERGARAKGGRERNLMCNGVSAPLWAKDTKEWVSPPTARLSITTAMPCRTLAANKLGLARACNFTPTALLTLMLMLMLSHPLVARVRRLVACAVYVKSNIPETSSHHFQGTAGHETYVVDQGRRQDQDPD